jgi:hypothetical protein
MYFSRSNFHCLFFFSVVRIKSVSIHSIPGVCECKWDIINVLF